MLVSVLLPLRDGEATIDESMRSILDQEGVDLELVVLDNGSTDRGFEIAKARAKADDRVVPIEAPDRELGEVLALGTRIARGEIIARMDQDDVSLPGRLLAQVAELERDPTLAAAGTLVEAFPAERVTDGLRRYVAWQNSLVSPADHARDLYVESPLCHPSVAMRRRMLEAAGGYRATAWAEDYDLWLRFAARGYGLAKVGRVLFRWRRGDSQMTFSHPSCRIERFDEAKAHYLAPILKTKESIAVWGAGRTGRRISRALMREGVEIARFIDIDPRKIGGVARGRPIVAPEPLDRSSFIVVAVGAPGGREIVRERLVRGGSVEGEHFLCAS